MGTFTAGRKLYISRDGFAKSWQSVLRECKNSNTTYYEVKIFLKVYFWKRCLASSKTVKKSPTVSAVNRFFQLVKGYKYSNLKIFNEIEMLFKTNSSNFPWQKGSWNKMLYNISYIERGSKKNFVIFCVCFWSNANGSSN